MSKVSQTITLSDGRKLGYAEYGDAKGKPVLFLHGWPSSRLRSSVYDRIGKEIHVRIVSPDRPGYGLSDFKNDRTLLEYADDIVELANQLNLKKFAVVGVSGGGPYAAVCAYKIPQRITKTGIVVGLGPTYIPHILDGMPFVYKIGWLNYSRFPIIAKLGSIYRMIVDKYSFGLIKRFDFRGGKDAEILKEIKNEWAVISKETWRQGYKGAEKDLLLYTSDWGFSLKNIKGNVYLHYGESDKNINLGTARYYKSQIKGSKLIIYPNEGHLISMTHAREILETLVN